MAQADASGSQNVHELFRRAGLNTGSYLRLVAQYEPSAARLFFVTLGSLAVPALCQTKEYAKQFITAPFLLPELDADSKAAEARWDIRKLRQEQTRGVPKTWFVEASVIGALSLAARSQWVIREQLQHIETMALQEELDLRVLPATFSGESSGAFGRWVDIGTDDQGKVLYFASDSVDQTRIRNSPHDLARATNLLQSLEAAALPPTESLTFFGHMVPRSA
jgi:hypothetical protein